MNKFRYKIMTSFTFTKIITLLIWMGICIHYNKNLGVYCDISNTTDRTLLINNENKEEFKSTYKGTEEHLIKTPGCYIPNYGKTLQFKEAKALNKSCGVRAVFIKKIANNNIQLNIDDDKINTYSHGKAYQCCLRFAAPRNTSGKIDLTQLEYSSCIAFENESQLELQQEIVTVSCHSKSVPIYEDAYIILKKLTISQDEKNSNKNSWNILLLGMDTMSRARLLSSMPLTAQYLRDSDWLDFRGYQKVGYNTFPNLISLITGKHVSAIYKACTKGLQKCSNFFLWDQFKEAGYKTAYGEEFLRLPDTFNTYGGFKISPTDHYMRPFFLTGEIDTGNFVCTKKMTSANHTLDYAYQFSDAYYKQKFFGFFWINSCTHNLNNSPTLCDKDFPNYFKELHKNGIMDNTFIIFISDHGIRVGKMREPVESYYEERLPMLYIWVPTRFRKLFSKLYANLQLNQERLVTPYDVYLTMKGMLKINGDLNEITILEACPSCKSLFEEISINRSCTDARVDEKWCTCHNMTVVDKNKNDFIRILQVITESLDIRTTNIKTKNCTQCEKFSIKTILRSHSYYDSYDSQAQNMKYFIVAFVVEPGDITYEAIVKKQNDKLHIISMLSLSPYNKLGFCVEKPNDRGFCVCEKILCKT